MSQEEVDLVMGLQRSGEEDFARLIREDELWQRVDLAEVSALRGGADCGGLSARRLG